MPSARLRREGSIDPPPTIVRSTEYPSRRNRSRAERRRSGPFTSSSFPTNRRRGGPLCGNGGGGGGFARRVAVVGFKPRAAGGFSRAGAPLPFAGGVFVDARPRRTQPTIQP